MAPIPQADRGVDEDRVRLERLILDPDFEQLEREVGRFNIFSAIGMEHQELRHSDFLRFLLDPSQPHGLSDTFLKRFLRRAMLGAGSRSLEVSLIELDCWNLDAAELRREWKNIDILVVDEAHQLIVLVENKVWAGEEGDQLRRYLTLVREMFSGWRVLPLFLSPRGGASSHPDYIPISYQQVIEVVEEVLDTHQPSIGPDVRTLMVHYTEMVRRRILNRSELDKLCIQLYHRHEQALKLILQRGQGLQANLREWLESLIREDEGGDGLILDYSNPRGNPRWVSFVPGEWDIPPLRVGTYPGFGTQKRVLLFWFDNNGRSLNLELQVAPAPADLITILRNGVEASRGILKWSHKQSGWFLLYRSEWLTPDNFATLEMEEIHEKVRERWNEFRAGDLKRITTAIRIRDWLRETGSHDEKDA